MKKATVLTGAGVGAVLTGLAAFVTSVHGSHSTQTTEDKTPIVINRPHAANGSPLPVTVTTAPNGAPLVIVGHGAPVPCPTVTPSPSKLPKPSPSPSSDCY